MKCACMFDGKVGVCVCVCVCVCVLLGGGGGGGALTGCDKRKQESRQIQKIVKRTSLYHRQASGLMGSPTVPRIFREDLSCAFTCSSPELRSDLIRVGAV